MIVTRTNLAKWKAAFTQLTEDDPTIRGVARESSPTNRLALFTALCQIAEALSICKDVKCFIVIV